MQMLCRNMRAVQPSKVTHHHLQALGLTVVHGVWQGEVMLRDGPYLGQPDLVMKVSGVYVPDSGRLHAIADPSAPLQLPFTAKEAEMGSGSYRHALLFRSISQCI